MQKTITTMVCLAMLFTIIPVASQAACRGPFCAGIDRQMASWVGHHVNELIAAWGVPQGTFPSGDEGIMVVYQQTTGGGQIWWQRIRTFFVDRNGIITSYPWRGL